MSVLLNALAAVFVVSLISLVGVFSLALRGKTLDKMLFYFISFAAGSLLAAAFFDLLPEAVEGAESAATHSVFYFVVFGVIVFFVLEKFLHWYHCHKRECGEHAFTYLNVVGDGLHNFVDGMIIAAAFVTNFALGVVSTLAIIAHEVPQEIGDFSILLYGGFSRAKALAYNFLTALTAFAGALAVLFSSLNVSLVSPPLLAFGAGGFVYIACTDLIPELHKSVEIKRSLAQFTFLLLGVAVILAAHSLLSY